jgi:hypothetical protein
MTNSPSKAQRQFSRGGIVCAECDTKSHGFVTVVTGRNPNTFKQWCHECYDKDKEREDVSFI